MSLGQNCHQDDEVVKGDDASDGSLAHFNDTSQKVASKYQELARYASDLDIDIDMSAGKFFMELG